MNKKITDIKKKIYSKLIDYLLRNNDQFEGQIKKLIFEWELKKDKNYRLDLVKQGFENRNDEYLDDAPSIERIITSYNKAKDDQKKLGELYQENNEWLPIYEYQFKNLIEALKKADVVSLKKMYRNFWRDPCSTGLVGFPVDMQKSYFQSNISTEHKKYALHDGLHRYNMWKSLIGSSARIEQLESPNIGNPYGLIIDGIFVKGGADYLHYYAKQINTLVKENKKPVVGELGGGYGGMAYYLLRDTQNVTYIDFDLPENMALTAYFLLNAFPNKKIALYGEVEINSDTMKAYDGMILPNFTTHKFADNSFDLIFNSYSLAEMAEDTISEYISEFSRLSREYILHVNHNQKSVVKADDFRIEDHGFSLLYKIPALWNLARDPGMDEFEYLYKKQNAETQ